MQPTATVRSAARALLRNAPFKPALFGALRKASPLPERLYRHLAFEGPIHIPLARGRGFAMHHFGHQVENDLFWAGFGRQWEATSLRLWVRLALRSDLVLDVGANTGVYALSAKAVMPSAEVLAYEPVARVHHRLVRNIALNGFEIGTHRVAVSNHNDGATLFDVPTEHVYSAGLSRDVLGARSDVTQSQVTTLRLEDALTGRPPIQVLIKIDTEGHEREVIEGLGLALTWFRPLMLVEILNAEVGARIAERLTPLGYRFFEIRERQGVFPTDHLGGSEGRNYLLCPEGKIRVLGLRHGLSHAELDLARSLAAVRS